MVNKERKAEVVWIVLKDLIKKEDVQLDADKIRCNVGNRAKQLGVKPEELKEVFSEMLRELTEEVMAVLK